MSGVLFLVNGGLGVDPGLLLAIPRMTAVGAIEPSGARLPNAYSCPFADLCSRRTQT